MTATVRPHTRLASALLAAGVVATASPLIQVPERAVPSVSFAAVQPTSVVTDVLNNVGDVVYGATWALSAPIYGLVSLPWNAVYALTTAVKDPALIPSVLSYVAQIYFNPDSTSGGTAYGVKEGLLEIISTLPNPLGTWAAGTVNTFSALVDGLFSAFPDSTAGGDVFEDLAYYLTPGRALFAVRQALVAPVEIIADVLTWLGYLPGQLEATLESAIRAPAEIPGLFSNLVRSVVDLNTGVLGWVVRDLVRPLRYLPDPIGDTLANGYFGLAQQWHMAQTVAVGNLLDALLPAPVTPTPFKKAAGGAVSPKGTKVTKRTGTGVSARGGAAATEPHKATSSKTAGSKATAGSKRESRRSAAE